MAETVADLIRAGGAVRWYCDAGGHSGVVDLERIACLRGPYTVLSDRRPRCRMPDCPGRVEFKDHRRVFARPLDTIPADAPSAWAYEERRRAELKALGYRLEMGKWVAPEKRKAPPATR